MFIACPGAGMTNVTFTSNASTLLSKLEARCALPVELVAEVEASRAAVVAVQRALNGARAHHQWFEGVVTEAEARAMVAEGEREAGAPSGGELNSFKYAVRVDVEVVADGVDDGAARDAYEHAIGLIRDMEARVVHEDHVALCARLRAALRRAGEARASA